MSATIATPRPSAVAISASEMPFATTPKPAEPAPAMSEKARMMPITVPKRPTKGASEPVVPMIQIPRRSSAPISARRVANTRSRSSIATFRQRSPSSNSSAIGSFEPSQSCVAVSPSRRTIASITALDSSRDFPSRPRILRKRSTKIAIEAIEPMASGSVESHPMTNSSRISSAANMRASPIEDSGPSGVPPGPSEAGA